MLRTAGDQRRPTEEAEVALDRLHHPVVLQDVGRQGVKLAVATAGDQAAVVEHLHGRNETKRVGEGGDTTAQYRLSAEVRLLVGDGLLNAISKDRETDPAQLAVAAAAGTGEVKLLSAHTRAEPARRADAEAVYHLSFL